MPGMDRPSRVAIGISELRITCRHSTRRRDAPLARAVRT